MESGEEETSVALMVLSDTSPRLGGYDLRAMIFSYLTVDEFLPLSETSKIFHSTIRTMQRVNRVPLNLSPSLEHIASSLAMFKYFVERERHSFFNVYEAIVRSGHDYLEVINYYAVKYGISIPLLADAAFRNGSVNIIQWLLENTSYVWNFDHCILAGGQGHLHVFQWATANGFRNGYSQYNAASDGHFHILKWLVSIGTVLDSYYCESLARMYGHEEIRRWILANTVTGNDGY